MGPDQRNLNKVGVNAWRRGFWDQHKGRPRHQYQGRQKSLQRPYQAGWYAAENNPDGYCAACFTNADLVVLALRFAIAHGGRIVAGGAPGQISAVAAAEPGWKARLAEFIKQGGPMQ